MNMSYATIPMVGGNKSLYSEKRSPYVVSSQDKLDTHAIYVVDTDLRSSIFFNDGLPCDLEIPVPIEVKDEEEFAERQEALKKKQKEEGLWTMYFDGSMAKAGFGAGIYIISPIRYFKAMLYMLTF